MPVVDTYLLYIVLPCSNNVVFIPMSRHVMSLPIIRLLLQELDEVFVTERQAHVRHIAAQRKALPAHLQGEEGLVKIQVGR